MIENTSKSRYIFHFKQIIKRSVPKDVSNSNPTAFISPCHHSGNIQIQGSSIVGEFSTQATTINLSHQG